jgi:hypothetical protein
MIRSPNFILQNVADSLVLVPVGEATRTFPGMVTMNETGAKLWSFLEAEHTLESLTAALRAEYDVDETLAAKDVAAYVQQLTAIGAIVE